LYKNEEYNDPNIQPEMSTSVGIPFWKQEEPNEQSHQPLTAHEVK
jgi:hypothetical protein